jgi:hypothetical protein
MKQTAVRGFIATNPRNTLMRTWLGESHSNNTRAPPMAVSRLEQKTDFKRLLSLKDPFVRDEETPLESRKNILIKADIIIPGNGKTFRVREQ